MNGDTKLAKLEPCTSRSFRRIAWRTQLTCDGNLVDVEECIECQKKRRDTRVSSGQSTVA